MDGTIEIDSMKTMKKILIAGVALIVSLNVLQAQSEYLIFNKDVQPEGTNIKFFKGEMYVISKELPQDSTLMPYIITLGADEHALGQSVDKLDYKPEDMSQQKNDFVKIDRKKNKIHIDISSIKTKSVKLITDKNKSINIDNKKITIEQNEVGSMFRLIIPNSVTLAYITDDLKEYQSLLYLTWWYYAIGLLILVVIIFVVWRVFIKKELFQKKEPIEVKYDYECQSLDYFAKIHKISLDDLLKMNKKVIDKGYKSYGNKEKKTVCHELKGKMLTVGFKEKEDVVNLDDNISEQLHKMQKNIINEIQQIRNNNSSEVNRLNIEVSDLKNENTRLIDAYHSLDSEKLAINNQYQVLLSENKRLLSAIEETGKRIIFVEYLMVYADSVCSYLKFCQHVSLDAYNSYNRINRLQQTQTLGTAGLLLLNFQTAVNSIPVGNWLQIIKDIKENGVTTNNDIIRCFAQIQDNRERYKEFQRLLFTDFLVAYSSNILILAESFRNLSIFNGDSELVFDIQNTFERHVKEILNKAKTVGIEIKYVPLFKNFDNYLGQIESKDKDKSYVYDNISGLQENAIAEIVSYGVKTIFENSKTIIILS